MRSSRLRWLLLAGCFPAWIAVIWVPPVSAIERLQGAWVPEGNRCESVFFRQGNSINSHRPGASVREALLVQGSRLSDARHRCTMSNVRQESDTQTALLTCFNRSISRPSKLSISLTFVDRNTVVRTFSDSPEQLHRCHAKRLHGAEISDNADLYGGLILILAAHSCAVYRR